MKSYEYKKENHPILNQIIGLKGIPVLYKTFILFHYYYSFLNRLFSINLTKVEVFLY